MPVSTSYKDDKNTYAVKSSKNKTIIATNIAGSAGNVVVRNTAVTSNTAKTSTSKANGNTVTDNYKERSVNDKFTPVKLTSQKQETISQKKIQESMDKYAGIYTEAEQTYFDQIASSNEIVGQNYKSARTGIVYDEINPNDAYKETTAYIKSSNLNNEFKTYTKEEKDKAYDNLQQVNTLHAQVNEYKILSAEEVKQAEALLKQAEAIRQQITDHVIYTEADIAAAEAQIKALNERRAQILEYHTLTENEIEAAEAQIKALNRARELDAQRLSGQTVTDMSYNTNLKTGDMDDNGFSNTKILQASAKPESMPVLQNIVNSGGRYMNLKNKTGFTDTMTVDTQNYFRPLLRSSGLWEPSKINHYQNFYRFGALNPTFSLSNCKEYLFFTKTDLNIFTLDDAGKPGKMNSYLLSQPFWTEMIYNQKYYDVLKMLQKSLDNSGNPFNFLLSNNVQSNLDLPNIAAESIDTPANMYGVNYDYRGSSEASNDSFQFSLEFRDNKWLPVYHYFKAYDEYQTIKHHGYIEPWKKYIANKILYDHFAIYKFLVDDDMETIIYYAQLYGVKPMSVPREAFSNTDFANGLSYNIDFKAAFVRDMQPYIITNFNDISRSYYKSLKYQIDVHNATLDRPDNRPAMGAYIEKVKYSDSYNGSNKGAIAATYAPGGFVYKLRWKGNTQV